jgi:uncharacterized metal-binding protein YceD (DUF177 family)
MNPSTFTIKVSDILLHSGTRDTITFTNIFSTILPGLQPEGISGTIILENLNKSEILITIENLIAPLATMCDRCGKDFIEQRILEDISIQAKILSKTPLTEDILSIEPKALTVDIEDFIRDQFFLHQPLKNLCNICEQFSTDEDEEIKD